jgi:hypothetical protein
MGAGTMALAGLLMLSAGALPAEVVPLREKAIQIPIELNKPAVVRELYLFVSTDQGRTWRQDGYATPDKKFFPFYAREDGIYWFQMQVVHKDGTKDPADLNQMKPALAVLVDTQPPILRITNADKVGDEVHVTWTLQEANPELESLRLEYRPAGDPAGQWIPVQITPLMAGQTRFRPATVGPVQVRMSVQDLCGNQAQAMQMIGANAGTGVVTAGSPPSAPPIAGPIIGPDPVLPPPPVRNDVATAPFQPPRDVPPPAPAPIAKTPEGPKMSPEAVNPIPPVATNSPNGNIASTSRADVMRNIQLINTTQISLDYEVPRVGPSGIKSVKLYMTRDDGRSWEELADDKDLQSPINATLPGEGLFGFRLVVESGAGLSKGMPMPGDAPELRIEVDLTLPYIELYQPAPDPKDRDTLILRWNAADKNLAPNPIMLEYSTSKTGPWAAITPQSIPNTGSFPWKLTQRLPYRVYLRVTAKDLAGNMGEVISPEPQLIDLTRPEAHLIGIRSTSVQIK